MANPFLTTGHEEIETAIMLEKAYVTDIGKAVAYTDGERVFINTEDNLDKILPAYCLGMLKWLLWHERYHMELRHHNRFFKYLHELSESETEEKFQVSKEEVNIIMDILVHDSLSKMFPELVEIAIANLAQMRNRNSLGYTFTTFTLEEMLDEYRKHKKGEDEGGEGKGKPKEGDEGDEGKESEDATESKEDKPTSDKKEHGEGGSKTTPKKTDDKKDDEPTEDRKSIPDEDDKEGDDGDKPAEPEHDKTDWSKLEDIDSKEFIDEDEGDSYVRQINELKRKKFRLAKITQTLNALATTTKTRTYRMPSLLQPKDGCIFKGKMPGKTALYLVFDASGSMSDELQMFKDIISKSVPQAMNCPCEWFSGWEREDTVEHCRYNKHYHKRTVGDYYKGKFKDIMPIYASGGYSDDGDRTIDLCFLAEQKGYTPIGVTDGGGGVYHDSTKEQIKALRRTVIVTQSKSWIEEIKAINPSVQTIYVG